jgi:plasmid maintenance system antidote protein VapI
MKTKKVSAESENPLYIEAQDEGAYLKARMHALGYGVTGFAQALGISLMAIYKVFNGEYALTRELVARLNAIDPEGEIVPLWRVEKKSVSKPKTAQVEKPAARAKK